MTREEDEMRTFDSTIPRWRKESDDRAEQRASRRRALAAIKEAATRGGVTVRRITRVEWSNNGECRGLVHGTDKDGERFCWWVEGEVQS